MHLTNTASNFDAEREESRAGFVKEAWAARDAELRVEDASRLL
jgi:hypothetical protein